MNFFLDCVYYAILGLSHFWLGLCLTITEVHASKKVWEPHQVIFEQIQKNVTKWLTSGSDNITKSIKFLTITTTVLTFSSFISLNNKSDYTLTTGQDTGVC